MPKWPLFCVSLPTVVVSYMIVKVLKLVHILNVRFL